ncbi:MAG: metal-sensing transcriptional repressor [Acidiferrobacteraceae bacterium]
MVHKNLHKTHPEIVKRLRRTEGHLRSVLDMLQAGRSCVDVAQQMHAIEKAIAGAKKTLIHDHIDHCLQASGGSSARTAQDMLTELKNLSKYL